MTNSRVVTHKSWMAKSSPCAQRFLAKVISKNLYTKCYTLNRKNFAANIQNFTPAHKNFAPNIFFHQSIRILHQTRNSLNQIDDAFGLP